MPDLDDVRGVSLATVHALTTATMIVGVPVLVGHSLVARRTTASDRVATPRPLAVVAAAALVGTGLTIATQRAAWALVRLWLGIDQPAARPAAQSSGR